MVNLATEQNMKKEILVGEWERRKTSHLLFPPKRVTACGASRMPNSSSIIEIVVERRRAGVTSTLSEG
jgi:hypothetical protein